MIRAHGGTAACQKDLVAPVAIPWVLGGEFVPRPTGPHPQNAMVSPPVMPALSTAIHAVWKISERNKTYE